MNTPAKTLFLAVILGSLTLTLCGQRSGNGDDDRDFRKSNKNKFRDKDGIRERIKDRKRHFGHSMEDFSEEEREELRRLHKADPEAFRAKIQEKMRDKNKEMRAHEEKTHALAEKYRQAEGEKKQELREQIISELKAEFHRRMDTNRKRLEQTEKRLEELREKLEERERNAEKIIEERFRDITMDPDVKW